MCCRQGQATRRKWFKVVKLNIYCFHTFKNIRECRRGNTSKAMDRCSTAVVSRDLSRLRTSRAITLCGQELVVNACMRTKMRLLCIYRPVGLNVGRDKNFVGRGGWRHYEPILVWIQSSQSNWLV